MEISPINDSPIAELESREMTSMQLQRIIIDGSSSYDIDDDSISYIWEIHPILFIESQENNLIVINTPKIESESVFEIILTVSDGELVSLPDTLFLTVLDIVPNDILPSFE